MITQSPSKVEMRLLALATVCSFVEERKQRRRFERRRKNWVGCGVGDEEIRVEGVKRLGAQYGKWYVR